MFDLKTRLCVSIRHRYNETFRLTHQAVAERGAELAEYRLDGLIEPPDLRSLLVDRPTPVIVACVPDSPFNPPPAPLAKWPPPAWLRTDNERISLFRQAVQLGADFIDIDVQDADQRLLDEIRSSGKTRLIVSYHDYLKTPDEDELRAIHQRLSGLGADVVKIVTTAKEPRDMLRVLRLLDHPPVPTVAFCMGEIGIPSRVLCLKYGAPFTYACNREREATAIGQQSFEKMNQCYHCHSLDSQTRVFGVLGDRVEHSLSPDIHNAGFQHYPDCNCVYVPFWVAPDVLQDSLEAFEELGVRGYSVTIPHKTAVLSRLQEEHCSDLVKKIGAANTLYVGEDGNWHATNTDYDAAMQSLLQKTGRSGSSKSYTGRLAGKKVLMLGAGGAARAIGMGVIDAGADLIIANRRDEVGRELAKELGGASQPWEQRGAKPFDILINCTSVGMSPHVDATPFDATNLDSRVVVFDIVYNPDRTLLLKQAEARGCEIVTGSEMFVRQAALQFERFAGRAPPLDLMRRVFLREIHQPRVKVE